MTDAPGGHDESLPAIRQFALQSSSYRQGRPCSKGGNEMKRWKNLVPAAGLLLAVAVSASAREWTDNTGTYKTEARPGRSPWQPGRVEKAERPANLLAHRPFEQVRSRVP